jgi:putative transposase
MPRHPRVFADATFYHVYNHAGGGESPFLGREEAEGFVERVREAKARDGLAIFAWCLMSNHYHMVVRTGQIPLCRSLLFIQERVVSSLDRRGGVVGPPWQSLCSVRELKRRLALDEVVAYVHLNPVAAGLTEDPARYRWSGHRELLGLEPPRVVDVEVALARFGAHPEEAHQAYLELLRRERSNTWVGNRSGCWTWYAGKRGTQVVA